MHYLFISKCNFSTSSNLLNAYRACLGKIKRAEYIRQYNLLMLKPDGELITARSIEPRYLIKMPADLKLLTDDEKRMRLASRKKKVIEINEDIIEDNFDDSKYFSYWKN